MGRPLLECHTLDPAKVFPPGRRSKRTPAAALSPASWAVAMGLWPGRGGRQREHVPGSGGSRPLHGPAARLAAHQGAGARPRRLREGGSMECPPGMGLLLLARPETDHPRKHLLCAASTHSIPPGVRCGCHSIPSGVRCGCRSITDQRKGEKEAAVSLLTLLTHLCICSHRNSLCWAPSQVLGEGAEQEQSDTGTVSEQPGQWGSRG